MYEVLLSHEAEKDYVKQDSETRRRIDKAIEALSVGPLKGPHIKKLTGKLKGRFRFALGGLRIVYKVENEKIVVVIIAIRSRGDVYKKG